MSYTSTLIDGGSTLVAPRLPAANAASSLAEGPGAVEMEVWTRRIDIIWAVCKAVADWYRREPIDAHRKQITCYLAEAKGRTEFGRSLRDFDRGAHLPV